MEVKTFQASYSFRHPDESKEASKLFVFTSGSSLVWASIDSHSELIELQEYLFQGEDFQNRVLALIQSLKLESQRFQSIKTIEWQLAWGGMILSPSNTFNNSELLSNYEKLVGSSDGLSFYSLKIDSLEIAQAFPMAIENELKDISTNINIQLASHRYLSESLSTSKSVSCSSVFLFPGGMDIWIVQNGVLQLGNRFFCTTKEDFIYNILNSGQQADWNPKKDRLVIGGFEERFSDLLLNAQNYVVDISVEELPNDPKMARMRLFVS